MDAVDGMYHWEARGSVTANYDGDAAKDVVKGDGDQDGVVVDLRFHWRKAHIRGMVVGALQQTESPVRRG